MASISGDQAILTIADRYPQAPIFLIGLSAGTTSVMRYAAELEHPRFKRRETKASKIAGVVAVGAGFNLPAAWDKCEFPYNEIILSELKELFLGGNATVLQVCMGPSNTFSSASATFA